MEPNTILKVTTPSQMNANILNNPHQNTDFGLHNNLDLQAAITEMQLISGKVKSGDLSDMEEMLSCQALALQNLFTVMASKISSTQQMARIDLYTRLALKAQNQCRSTIATLSEMKSPKRVNFINQQNNANQMQVKNEKIS